MKEHDNRRRAIINYIRENKLKLSPENCEFLKSHVTNEGNVLTPEGIQPNHLSKTKEKICAIVEFLNSKHFSVLYNANPIGVQNTP